ncbi:unnamed protein product [Caenorhabditis angaria]|uniref:Uncharacterized protein n=1 Tax=Caenorhabditis angaria TaxID=860376 RepID=A0A9P1I8H2_9PELO|nr:unnamed protein product [Caenorhabditis angaria]
MDYDEEVRRRKEYADRKVRERHEKMKREMEEKRKGIKEHRDRVQSQLRREQELIQKRMQQLNEDEERKKATLAKQHTETSRTANLSKSPKQAGFGFGSATPRTLTYLDNLPKSEQLYDKRLKPRGGPIESGLTTPQSRSGRNSGSGLGPSPNARPPPAARRPPPAMNAMTSSMYVAPTGRQLTRGAPPLLTNVPPRPAIRHTPPRQQNSANLMTQSVYTPPTSRVRSTVVAPIPRGARKIVAKETVTQAVKVKKTVVEVAAKKKPAEKPLEIHVEKSESPEVHEVAEKVQESSPAAPEKALEASEIQEHAENLVEIAYETPEVHEVAEKVQESSPAPEQVQEVAEKVQESSPASEKALEASEIQEVAENLVEIAYETPEVAAAPEQVQEVAENVTPAAQEAEKLLEAPEAQESSPVAENVHEDGVNAEKSPEVAAKAEEASQVSVVEEVEEIAENVEEVALTPEPAASRTLESSPAPEESPVPTPRTIIDCPAAEDFEETLKASEDAEATIKASEFAEVAESAARAQESSPAPQDPEAYELNYQSQSPAEISEQSTMKIDENDTFSSGNLSSELVDVFGNDYIGEHGNRPNFELETEEDEEEETDSGKASPSEEDSGAGSENEEEREKTPRQQDVREQEEEIPTIIPLVKKVQTKSSEDLAKEQKEADDRKRRLEAILAKSRGMAMPTAAQLPGAVIPPTSSSSSDILSRLASQSHLPSLQKLLQRKAAANSNPSLETQETPSGGEIQYP